MRRDRNLPLPLVLVALAAGWAAPRPDESPAAPALKARGLAKSGTAYTIEAERPVLAKLKEARTAFAAYAATVDQQARQRELAQQVDQIEEQRAELQAQVDDLNLRISDNAGAGSTNQGLPGGGPGGGGPGGGGAGPGGMTGRGLTSPLTIRRDQLKLMLNQVAAEQRRLKGRVPSAKETEAVESRVKSADEQFKNALGDLRKLVDAVKQQYADLAADEAVKAALAEARKANPKIHLGPSDALTAGVRELEKAEQRFLGKRTTAVSRKKVKTKK